ncbi:TonB-dependent receptor [Granulicella sp. WH15]|nr:TonB-dependent receptor [Granulicella sp. WH15]
MHPPKKYSILSHTIPLLAVLLLVLGYTLNAKAQTTASLSGIVQDVTGAVIPNAHIVLTNAATEEKRELNSNASGFFTFAGIVPGTYAVDITANGFRGFRQSDIMVNPGDTRSLQNLNLAIGTSNETVTVQSSVNYVAPEDSAERSSLLTTHDIDRLPIQSRNMSELLKILPGVTTTASGTGNGPGFDFSDTGSSGSAVGVGLNTNGAPYRGGTAYLLDGASIIDPGCACWSIATVNPDMTQEVKVQSSNFGADSAQGPVVINVISRSGTAEFHGQGYFYARNGVLNANSWQDKHSSTPTARPQASYYYPGGSIGGPILIPHTNFNHNRKLIFWAGFESFRQNLPAASPLTSYVPTAAMRAGNFSLTDPANAALCAKSTGNDFCQPLTGGFAPDGAKLTGTQIPTQYLDPGALALLKLFPTANVDPSTNASGYNYFLQPSNLHNGYIYRGRVDYNLSEKNKIFVSYQYGSDSETTVAHIYYNPSNAVAYPAGPLISPVHSHVLSGSYIHIFNSSATNEVRISTGWLDNPYSASDLKAAYNSTIGYPYGTVYSTASLLAPAINSPGARTLPDISQPDLFQQGGTFNSIKKAPSVSDDFTVVYKSHTFKIGGFWSRGGNKQGTYGYTNGSLSYASGAKTDQLTGLTIGTVNPLANFLLGITSGFTQNNTNPIDDMFYNTGAGYVLDNWKVKPRLTLNLGLRLEHIGRWRDANGTGLAVWEPNRYAADVVAKKVYPGVYWHAIDPSVPVGGSPVQTIFLEPRLGLAYDVRGNGSTVVRGGWAAYRWNDQYNDYAGPLTTSLGVKTYNSNGGQAITLKEIGALGSSSNLGSLPSSVYATDQNDDKTGVTYAYNLTISQRLAHAMLFEIAYVGNQTQNILLGGQSNGSGVGGTALVNQNKIPLGGLFRTDPVTGAPAPTDPENVPNIVDYYPYYQGYGTNAVSVNTHSGYANYNGLQLSLMKQAGRISYNINYTYSKSLGIIGSTLDAFNVRNNYGVLNIDRPHVVNTSYAFDLGSPIHGNRFAGGAVNGWTLTGTTTWQAGGNLQANTSQNLGLTIQNTNLNHTIGSATYYGTPANSVLPILTCNPASNLKTYQHVNLDCFTAPQIGQVGIRQAPYLSTPSFFDSDLGIYKSFHIVEHQTLELRGTAFNFLNHPLPGFSTSDLTSIKLNTADNKTFTSQVPNVNRGITDAKYTQRTLLLAVKYRF